MQSKSSINILMKDVRAVEKLCKPGINRSKSSSPAYYISTIHGWFEPLAPGVNISPLHINLPQNTQFI